MSQNIYLCPTCRLKSKLQLKSQKVIVHIVVVPCFSMSIMYRHRTAFHKNFKFFFAKN